MGTTIGLVANVYQEVNALPGWLETHTPFFDDIRIMHAGPQGAYSDDGTIELLEKWNIPVKFCAIDDGFGTVRTKTLRMSPCDYIMLLDADERFYPLHRQLTCDGESTPHSEVDAILKEYDLRDLSVKVPNWDRIGQLGSGLEVRTGVTYNQGGKLRELLAMTTTPLDAICTVRRHWHDFSFKRPTQNWLVEPDWQMRIVRNDPDIHFDTETRMHERLVGVKNIHQADIVLSPFFDHFHFPFKRMEMEQRSHDVAIYDAIHQGLEPPQKPG